MSKSISSIMQVSSIAVASCLALSLSTPALGFGTDPVSSYLTEGKTVGSWKMTVGNGLNWSIPVKNQEAKTARGNLTVSPTSKNGEDDALNLRWKGKKVKTEWGGNALYDTSFNIRNNNIDISSVAEVAALVIDIRVLRAPNENAKITMQCNNNNDCMGEYSVKGLFKRVDKDKWLTVPIPLSCFNDSDDFDFSKITGVFTISTQGKMEIDIANIGLAGLPAGSENACQ